MSSHDPKIGQEWTGESLGDGDLSEFVELLGDENPHQLRRVVAYLTGRAPHLVREAVLHVEHTNGRHRDGRCPELCPRF